IVVWSGPRSHAGSRLRRPAKRPRERALLDALPLQANRLLNRRNPRIGALNVTEEPSRIALPSATGFAARQAIAALRKRNVPIAPLLKRASVSEGDIDNRQRRISAVAQGKLLEYAAEALGDNEFGLHLAEQANPREAGLLFYVASAAEDIGDA